MIKGSIKVCALAVGTLAVAAGSLAVTIGGCSSSTNGNTSTGDSGGTSKGDSGTTKGDGGTSPTGDGGSTGAACTGGNNIFTIAFSPMYSAVIPGDNTHTFAIPAIVSGVSGSAVTWTASSNAVTLASDPSTGGVLITMSDTGTGGTVVITATAGAGSCGTSTLNITSATIAQWAAGNSRYNDASVPFDGLQFGNSPAPDGGFRYACTSCHAEHGGDAGAGLGFNDVAHTPEQTGGFSDPQLLGIIQHGDVPGYSDAGVAAADAGYFDPTIVPYREWHHFHQWGLTAEEQTGIVVYLRSLTPTAQNGSANFGGFTMGDGGFHHHHDGGFGPPPMGDAATPPTGDL